MNNNTNQYWNQCEDMSENGVTDESAFDSQLILDIQKERNLFRLMTASLCPQIYGHELVKSALVLALFGGTDKQERESPQMSTRGQIHVLLFGDHGSNKDVLLKSVHSIAPKGKYLCGNTATINTLATRVMKHKNQEYLQKGSLLSKHFAICCVDEFERMNPTLLQYIEEVMEYQTISFNRNGKSCKLSAKTSMIAAVNPINGCYDWSLNVWQNTKLNKSILSKFDLIFNLIDSPDEELDSKLSKHILNSRNDNSVFNQMPSHSFNTKRNDCKLMSKLIFGPEDEEPDLLPPELLRRYVSYAQKYIQPVLTDEAIQLLTKFCSEMSKTEISKSRKRDINSLFRLAEARARLECRQEVTEEDANDVIDIVRHSIGKNFLLKNNVHSLQIIHSFNNKSKNKKTPNLLKALQIFAEQNQQNMFSVQQIIDISSKFQIPFDSKEEILQSIDRLNNETLLLKNGSNYRLTQV